MLELVIFFAVLILLCFIDIRLMVKRGQKKEMIPYLVFMLATSYVGVLFFSNPFRDSIARMVISIFKIKGYFYG